MGYGRSIVFLSTVFCRYVHKMPLENADPENYTSDELDSLADAVRYQRWIVEQFAPYVRGRVLEVGAGIGTMANYWIRLADEVHLVEPARNLFSVLHERYSSVSSVRLYADVLDHIVDENGAGFQGSFDAVIMVNVLEHIQDDAQLMNTLVTLLKPEGYLLVFVPAMPALYGSLDRRFGHYRRYTKSSLLKLMSLAHFHAVKLYYFDVLGVAPWWLVNCVIGANSLNRSSALLYDRYVVPLGRTLERWLKPPIGKNLVLIAKH